MNVQNISFNTKKVNKKESTFSNLLNWTIENKNNPLNYGYILEFLNTFDAFTTANNIGGGNYFTGNNVKNKSPYNAEWYRNKEADPAKNWTQARPLSSEELKACYLSDIVNNKQGLSIMLNGTNGLGCIDIDKQKDEAGDIIESDAQFNQYREEVENALKPIDYLREPSRNGYHYYFKLPPGWRENNPKASLLNREVEIYTGKRHICTFIGKTIKGKLIYNKGTGKSIADIANDIFTPASLAKLKGDPHQNKATRDQKTKKDPRTNGEVKPGKIPMGKRHNEMISRAGKLRKQDFRGEALEAELKRINENCCEPPLGETEMQEIIDYAHTLNGSTHTKPHEIAQHIVNLKGDLLRVGPSDNAGRENLYIINEGILKKLKYSDLGRLVKHICGKAPTKLILDVSSELKSTESIEQIENLHSYTTRNACLFEGDDILNITQDDSGGEKLELTTLEKYLAEGGAPFHERFTFALDTKLFSSAVAFGSDEDELKSAVECFCPEWHRFLKTSLVSYEYDCIPLLEFVGNFLLPINSPMRRGFWFLVGKSKSGKTTLLDLCSNLVGEDYVGEFDPGSNLNDKFALSWIYEGKRRAIESEGKDRFIDTTYLNKIAEGGYIKAEAKNQKDLRPKGPFCCVIASNHWPKIKDSSGASENRPIIIVFERDESTPIDSRLFKKLKKEAPAFCALAMARLAYLIESEQTFTPTYAKRSPDIQQKFNFTEDPLATRLRSAIRCGGDADYYQKIAEKYGDLFTKDPAISWQSFTDWIADLCEQDKLDPGEYLKIDKKNDDGRIIDIYSLKKETRQKILTELVKRGAIYEPKSFRDPANPERFIRGLKKCFFID